MLYEQISLMAQNNPSPADIAGIISSVAVAVVLTVVGIYSRLASVNGRRNGRHKDEDETNHRVDLAGKVSAADIDRAFVIADDYRERLRVSEINIESLRTELKASKLDCVQQIEAVNVARDKQLAAVVADYDGKIDKLVQAQSETDKRLIAQADYIAELRAELDTWRGGK